MIPIKKVNGHSQWEWHPLQLNVMARCLYHIYGHCNPMKFALVRLIESMGFPHHFLDVASKLKRVLVLYTHGVNDVNRVTKWWVVAYSTFAFFLCSDGSAINSTCCSCLPVSQLHINRMGEMCLGRWHLRQWSAHLVWHYSCPFGFFLLDWHVYPSWFQVFWELVWS